MSFKFHLLSLILTAILAATGTIASPAPAADIPCKYAGVSSSSFSSSCTALAKKIKIENATIDIVQFVAAGTNLTFPNAEPSCSRPYQVVPVDLCRVNMSVATSNMSSIVLETWLPKNWTGRFLSTGNGGLSGCIQFEDIAYTASQGFAAVGANNGHNGQSGKAFYQNNEVIADFAYRSIHLGVVIGKRLTEKFYGVPHKRSYYLGCSTGGRQGFKSLERYPHDFDGLVVGAPAIDFEALNVWSSHFYAITGKPTENTWLPAALWVTVHNEVLNQCDGLDGYKDSIIEDPDLCIFNAMKLLCAPGVTSNCLTLAQIGTVDKVYSAIIGQDGKVVYPRLQPGAEIAATPIYFAGAASPFVEWLAYAIFQDPTWDSYTLVADNITTALKTNPFNIATWEGDLSPFRATGGKILHYHGMQDQIISSDNSKRYYDFVSKTMGQSSSKLDQFYRYFRISGMQHCSGGPGAWKIGQTAKGQSVLTAQDNVLMRIVEWVEKGAAPETVRGTKYINDTVSLGVAFVRDHCRYPRRNVYNGKNDPTKASSWNCI